MTDKSLKEKVAEFKKETKVQEIHQKRLAKLGNVIINELDSILAEEISNLNLTLLEGYKLHPIYSWTENGKPYVGFCMVNSRRDNDVDQNVIDKKKEIIQERFKELEQAYNIVIGWR